LEAGNRRQALLFPSLSQHFRAVSLSRIAWLTTVLACLMTAVLLFLSGYEEYPWVAIAVGFAAAINLR
jgi:hypothetical protein